MPEYSVTLRNTSIPRVGRQASPLWSKTQVLVNAVSIKHAMKKAEAKINDKRFPPYVALSARRITVDHDKWRKIWRQAYNNIPTRIYVEYREGWVFQEPDTTPLPEFIKQEAHGMMKQESGNIYRKVVTRRAHKMGAQAALTKLLGYAKWNKQSSMAHFAVLNAMARGSVPNTKERRELLLRLAGPNGTKIAAEMLGRPFRPLKIKGAK